MIPFIGMWDGENFVPALRFMRALTRDCVVGENYRLVEENERSMRSHNHYMASVAEGWRQLPESIADNFPTETHLRKRALVDAGYYDEEVIDCGSNRVAVNVAAAIRKRDDFALIFIRDQFVIIRTAKSQSLKAMGDKDFKASKQAVLEIIAGMVRVTVEQLANARAA